MGSPAVNSFSRTEEQVFCSTLVTAKRRGKIVFFRETGKHLCKISEQDGKNFAELLVFRSCLTPEVVLLFSVNITHYYQFSSSFASL